MRCYPIFRRTLLASLSALALQGCVHANQASTDDTLPTVDARSGIIEALATHRVVLLGEIHRSRVFHEFLLTLLADRRFPDLVNDIVIESGNARFQPILDRYIRGEDVPADSVRLVWRETTQPLVWNSPVYAEFLAAVRRLNATLPAAKRLRVLAGDPPIDWKTTHNAAEIPRSYGDRDIETFKILERETLSRNRRALVIIGVVHTYRAGPGSLTSPPAFERASLGDQLERRYPRQSFIIMPVVGTSHEGLTAALRGPLPQGRMVTIARSPARTASSSVLFGSDVSLFAVVDGKRVLRKVPPEDYPPLSATIDALVYLGPNSETVPANPSIYANDPKYVTELRRRIGILTQLFGIDLWTEELDAALKPAG